MEAATPLTPYVKTGLTAKAAKAKRTKKAEANAPAHFVRLLRKA
jgi:hypothetical protein